MNSAIRIAPDCAAETFAALSWLFASALVLYTNCFQLVSVTSRQASYTRDFGRLCRVTDYTKKMETKSLTSETKAPPPLAPAWSVPPPQVTTAATTSAAPRIITPRSGDDSKSTPQPLTSAAPPVRAIVATASPSMYSLHAST